MENVKHGDENHLGNVVFMDEWLTNSSGKRHRLTFHAVVKAADRPYKITWQMRKAGLQLPAFVTLKLQDSPEGVSLKHELCIGLDGIGKILDPFIRLYFNESFQTALDEHCKKSSGISWRKCLILRKGTSYHEPHRYNNS